MLFPGSNQPPLSSIWALWANRYGTLISLGLQNVSKMKARVLDMVRLNTMSRIWHIIIFLIKKLEYGSPVAIESQLQKTWTMCILSFLLSYWSPPVLHRSILLIMDRAPQNKVLQVGQVICNEAVTVLVSIQVFNFVSEMYSSLLKFQSSCTCKSTYN